MIDEMKEEKTNQSLINGRREAGWWSGASRKRMEPRQLEWKLMELIGMECWCGRGPEPRP